MRYNRRKIYVRAVLAHDECDFIEFCYDAGLCGQRNDLCRR